MLKLSTKRKNIIKKLSILHYYVRASAKAGYTNINKDCESFFCALFNLVWDMDLKSLNGKKKNHEVIDLESKKKKIAVQITSTNTSDKASKTIKGFTTKFLNNPYKTLIIFIIGEKTDYHRKNSSIEIRIIDIYDLIDQILAKDKDDFDEIAAFINNETDEVIETITKEKTKLKLFHNANAFIMIHLGESDLVVVNRCRDELTRFAGDISRLAKKHRRLICQIIEYRVKDESINRNNDTIYFDGHEIMEIRGATSNELSDDFNTLDHRGFVELDTGIPNIGELREGEDYNIFYELMRYCEEYEKDIENIIVNLDFTELD